MQQFSVAIRKHILFTSLCTTWVALVAILLLVCMDTYLLHYFWHGKYSICAVLGYLGRKHIKTGKPLENEVLLSYKNLTINYDTFVLREPLFTDDRERKSFYMHEDNVALVGLRNISMLVGRVMIHKRGTVHPMSDCGWTMNPNSFLKPIPNRRKARHTHEILCPLLVPNSNTFQHFIDGVLPKLAQIQPLLHPQYNITFLFYRPWDSTVKDMLARIGLQGNRIQFYDGGYHYATRLLNTCITPPVHPVLFQKVRQMLGVTPAGNRRASLVILLNRNNTRNTGRRIMNLPEVEQFLRSKYSTQLHIHTGEYSFQDTLSLFRRASLLIGVHGGAFYNLIFCQVATRILEVMPVNYEGRPVPANLAHTIVWQMSHALNHTYLRLTQNAINSKGDIYLSTDKLQTAISILEGHG